MAELRQRNIPASDSSEKQNQKTDVTGSDEEDEFPPGIELGSTSDIPQGTDATPEVLDTALKDLTPRWRNWVIRGIFTWVMIFGFAFIIYLGPLALVLVIMAIQIKCFHEIINIGYVVYKSHNLPWFRTLSWYFLFASNWFFFGESLAEYFGLLLERDGFLRGVLTYHRFISFSMYVCGFVAFVFSLVKKHYLKQFTLFGWTHVTLLIVVFNSHLIIQNIFEGLIWLLVPVSMIICNDIMAYMFGFFFGKTPLIKLSPKKTWEGFIGGAISTIVFSIMLSYVLVQYDYFVCPISYDEALESLSMKCERNPVFRITAYKLPDTLAVLLNLMRMPYTEIKIYPFIVHCVFISLFASIVGPFGGFFASGFKRAFRIKDFGDTIPGHGGIMDRFDCQFLMALFVHVYHYSFIQVPDPRRLVMNVVTLKPEEQIQVFLLLKERLMAKGLINSTMLS